MKTLFIVAAFVLFMGCTPAQIVGWQRWYERDPVAATEFANLPETQNNLHNDWDQDGVVESEPTVDTSSDGPQFAISLVWDDLAWCESGGNWNYNGGSGYDGGLQFLPSVWRAYGGRDFAEYAWQASRSQQIVVAERILDDVGWQAWPTCSRKLGLR